MPRRATRWAGSPADRGTLEPDIPLIRPQDSGEAVDEGGLARAVGADQRGNLAPVHAEN